LTYKLGLPKSEIYYLRVNHKRLFSAPCLAYALDVDNNGIVDGQTGSCSCGSGDSCNEIKSVVTAASCLQTEVPAADPADPPTSSATYFCPDGSAGTQVGGDASSTVTCAVDVPVQCETSCLCVAWGGVVELPENAVTSEYNFTWNATHLPPGTYATDAYQDFQSRPSPYN
jgi:hypothetical protein